MQQHAQHRRSRAQHHLQTTALASSVDCLRVVTKRRPTHLVSREDHRADDELHVAELLDKGEVLQLPAGLHAGAGRAQELERLGRALLVLVDRQVLDRVVALRGIEDCGEPLGTVNWTTETREGDAPGAAE